ncbi:hypothetical protein [Promicromonospora sp. NPDC023987]|uniref:hypothetical protein n=1 Tax=Promicromonospora sp. NPDC023987 TaxID=3155360 RepID=UPI003403BD26
MTGVTGPLYLRALYWLSVVAAVICVVVGVILNSEVNGPDATGMDQAPFYPVLALVTWLVAAAYGAHVVAWLRAPASARDRITGVRPARTVFDGGLGVIVTAIVTVALTTNDPGEPGAAVLWLRWIPVLLVLALTLVAAVGGARSAHDAPSTDSADHEGLV